MPQDDDMNTTMDSVSPDTPDEWLPLDPEGGGGGGGKLPRGRGGSKPPRGGPRDPDEASLLEKAKSLMRQHRRHIRQRQDLIEQTRQDWKVRNNIIYVTCRMYVFYIKALLKLLWRCL